MGLLDDAGKNITDGFAKAREKAEDAGEFLGEKAKGAGEFIKDKAEDVGEFVEDTVDRIKGDDDHDEDPAKGGAGV